MPKKKGKGKILGLFGGPFHQINDSDFFYAAPFPRVKIIAKRDICCSQVQEAVKMVIRQMSRMDGYGGIIRKQSKILAQHVAPPNSPTFLTIFKLVEFFNQLSDEKPH